MYENHAAATKVIGDLNFQAFFDFCHLTYKEHIIIRNWVDAMLGEILIDLTAKRNKILFIIDPCKKFFLRLVTVVIEENYAQENRKNCLSNIL